MKLSKNIWNETKETAKKGLVTLLIPAVIGIGGCSEKNKYVEEHQEMGRIDIDLLNELPSYSFAQSSFFHDKISVEENIGYRLWVGKILNGKYTDMLKLNRQANEKTLIFVDYGQDGIVDELTSEFYNSESGIQIDTLDLVTLNHQSNVSRFYQNLMEKIKD